MAKEYSCSSWYNKNSSAKSYGYLEWFSVKDQIGMTSLEDVKYDTRKHLQWLL